jgi:hypothetical protein
MEREKVKMNRMDKFLVWEGRSLAIVCGVLTGVAASALLNPHLFPPDRVVRIQTLLPHSLLGSAVGAKFADVVEKILRSEEKI